MDDLRPRTSIAIRKYNMPLVVQKRLKNAIEWIHDFQRTGNVPTIDGLDQDLFPSAIINCRRKGGDHQETEGTG